MASRYAGQFLARSVAPIRLPGELSVAVLVMPAAGDKTGISALAFAPARTPGLLRHLKSLPKFAYASHKSVLQNLTH